MCALVGMDGDAQAVNTVCGHTVVGLGGGSW